MNKIEFLEQIEAKVKDVAGEITVTTSTKGSGELSGNNTIFPVNSVTGFDIGDEVYLNDRNGRAEFTRIIDLLSPDNIEVAGDLTAFPKGTLIKETDADNYLDEAINLYSIYRPYERTEKRIIPVGNNIFDLPDDWENGFSEINYIDYPLGVVPTNILPKDRYEIYLDENNIYRLRFERMLYDLFIINYTKRHSFNSSNPPEVTVPDCDFYCVCNIAAGYYLLALANRYGQNVAPTIGTSAIDYSDRTERYRKLAGELFSQAASWLRVSYDNDGNGFFEVVGYSSDQPA